MKKKNKGANIGTTITALLAALATDSLVALQIAIVHVMFRLTLKLFLCSFFFINCGERANNIGHCYYYIVERCEGRERETRSAVVAFCYLGVLQKLGLVFIFFSVVGMLIWYPIPFMRRIPMSIASALGSMVGKR